MNTTDVGVFFAGGLFLGILLLLETGRRIGSRRLAADPDGARQGTGVVEGAVFGLLGLMIAFTFSGAANRFDTRRMLIIEEANHIGTAWLRLDVLPETARPELRKLFRDYLDARIATYQKLPDLQAAEAELARSVELQAEIWQRSVAACNAKQDGPVTSLVLSSLNAMFDITTTRTGAARLHPPWIIFAMLGVLSLAASLLAGFGMAGGKTRNWIHILGFAVVMSCTVYVIIDIEHPRLGLIRVDSADEVLIQLRESMD